MPLTPKQAPYTGVYSNNGTHMPSSGATVEAIKRALARLGFMEWKGKDFTPTWPAGGVLDKAFREWERSRYLPGNGVYGEQEWKMLRYEKVKEGPNAGKPAFDAYACKLIRLDWAAQNVPDEADFRKQLTTYCLKAEANEQNWHYVQYRPVDITVEPNAAYVRADCSSFVIMAYKWASTKSGLAVPDPSKMNWTGYGNTDQHEDDHPHVTAPYRCGDLAHYPGHVTMCRKPGTDTSAIFTSHGQEAGPMPTTTHYRSDFKFVVRPPLK